ncbi:nucleotidyltransferase family protein [Sinorhizobium medicae]|uniref:Nucleotidyltransferase family protein n=1 Tax=Sinorhizobium medicae TaxID=110321 RepID=A0ABX4TBW5_9HYPH|nr:nucleotidyltransferase family protein [Sinorhizobium medicae]PLT92540.1 hypothetical protein BMJ33_33635 [Sinorhizobium medicae]PLU13919.1 hypothetical protein BMJ29_29190 [Sinorhizobium medicae]PLU20453.1 hypothetical protein BMJ30_08815 [Sinorhizobium medicae]PLU26344.1 hypothetical protein BMJ27_34050 [Sinorhizobium medicae]PLU77441.1 hypothetical protein BMJ19_23780 [Sinorhizobium medicae]
MKARSSGNLLALASCLNGRPPTGVDWEQVIALANESLTVASLAVAARKYADDIPEDVRQYLSLIYDRNAQRNRRLLAQLTEAASCLNRIGVEPVLMKGAAILISQKMDEIGARMLTDLDILVRPADMVSSIGALKDIGYEVRLAGGNGSWPGNRKFHLPAVLERPTDAGSIDLQCRPKGPASFSDMEWLDGHSRKVDLDGGKFHIPSAFAQIVFLILHDQFQDGDYWRGLIDLRHLLDLSKLAASEDVDWKQLMSLFARGYERNAVETQILTADKLFGINGAPDLSAGKLPRFQLQRRWVQLGRDYLFVPSTVFTLLSELSHYRSWDRYGGEPYPSRRQEAGRKIRELRRVFRPKASGKI